MKICRMIKYDIRQGFGQNRWKLLAVAGMAVFFCIDFFLYRANCYHGEMEIPQATCMDYLFYMMGGAKKFDVVFDKNVPFPARWILLNSYFIYSTLYYSVRDFNSMGKVILPKTKSRWRWWISKCLWNGMYILCSYGVLYGVVLLWCGAVGEKVSFEITAPLINRMLEVGNDCQKYDLMLSVYMIVVPVLIMIGLAILQMALSLFLSPILAFGVIEIVFVLSIYFCNFIAVGNYAMPIRSEYVMYGGFRFENGIICAVGICMVSMIVGGICFQRHDMLSVEN